MSKVVLSDIGLHSTQHLGYKHKCHEALSGCGDNHLLPKGWGVGSQWQFHGQWSRDLIRHRAVLQHLGEMSRPDLKTAVRFTESQNGRGWRGPLWVI